MHSGGKAGKKKPTQLGAASGFGLRGRGVTSVERAAAVVEVVPRPSVRKAVAQLGEAARHDDVVAVAGQLKADGGGLVVGEPHTGAHFTVRVLLEEVDVFDRFTQQHAPHGFVEDLVAEFGRGECVHGNLRL